MLKTYTLALMFKPHVRICLAAFTLDFAVMIGMVVTPFFVMNQLGGTTQTAGIFGAVGSAVYASSALISARFVSRAKNGLNWAVSGILVFAVFYTMMAIFSDWRVSLAVSCIGSAALSLVWPALHSWVGAEPNLARRARTMSWFNISWSFGFSLSPLVAGPLYDAHYALAFAALFGVTLVALALVKSLPHESAHFDAPTEALLLERAQDDRASEVFLYSGWCATFVANMLAGGLRFTYPKRIDDLVRAGELHLLWEETPAAFWRTAPATNFSYLVFAFSLATALTFLYVGRTNWWKHRFGIMAIMQAGSAAAYYVLGRTQSLAVMCLCCAVAGSFLGLAFFSATYYSLSNAAHKHGRASINEASVGFGGFLGSLGCGMLAERFGVPTPFLYTYALIGLGIVVQWALLKYGESRATR
ncbi:MAG: MFS transporter [Candidatus Hydrogenedentes bacterium]|nr:MFS transporter [Candidatus Hydrogenedentota bacterium]